MHFFSCIVETTNLPSRTESTEAWNPLKVNTDFVHLIPTPCPDRYPAIMSHGELVTACIESESTDRALVL